MSSDFTPPLLRKVVMLGHAGQLNHPVQHDLAPTAAHLRVAQGGAEVARLLGQELVRFREALDLLLKATLVPLPVLLKLAHVVFVMLEGFAEGFDEAVNGLLALAEIAFRVGDDSFEGLPCEFKEGLIVALQGICGEGFEGIGEAGFCLEESLLFEQVPCDFRELGLGLDARLALGVEGAPERLEIATGVFDLGAQLSDAAFGGACASLGFRDAGDGGGPCAGGGDVPGNCGADDGANYEEDHIRHRADLPLAHERWDGPR